MLTEGGAILEGVCSSNRSPLLPMLQLVDMGAKTPSSKRESACKVLRVEKAGRVFR
jgi:hypothetical protein